MDGGTGTNSFDELHIDGLPVGESNVSGEELYRRLIAGDNYAFVSFVKMYQSELSRYLYGIVYDFHETEQLTIETFSQLVLNKKKFDGKSSIKTYLLAIGKNLSMQFLKMRGREQHLTFEEAAEIPVSEGETPQSILERNEKSKYLKEVLQELKEEYRAVLVLLYFEDMSYLQAGRAMGKSEKQIRNLAHRAKLALRKKMESKGYTRGRFS